MKQALIKDLLSNKSKSKMNFKRKKPQDEEIEEESDDVIDESDTSIDKNVAKRKIKAESATTAAGTNGKLKRKENDRADRAESSSSTAAQSGVMPKEMYQICKSLLEMDKERKLHLSGKKGNVKFSQLLRDTDFFDESFDINGFQNSFAHFYRWATSLQEIPLTSALQLVIDYVQSEQILQKHPKFPKRPANPYARFITNSGKNMFSADGSLKAEYKNKDDPRVIKANQEYTKDKERYLNELCEFAKEHQDELFQSQITFLQKEIKRAKKGIEEHQVVRRRPKQQQQIEKEQLTAFDLYKRSKKDKYMHLPEEEREAKLRRHFDKLPAQKLEVYESLAATF